MAQTDEATARRGVLKQLSRVGGSQHIKELHEFSTLRFGRGHQEFSALMEGLVGEGLVMYDGALFHLTDDGKKAVGPVLM